ncbi:TetR family transcriptional regulator [Pendulispora rubella]|uniref:TetR family transcriptional regulator n=1 Tax=Pendulispora rubella TaxID=2741070 RepID=A0ABZ2KYK0_9BACT
MKASAKSKAAPPVDAQKEDDDVGARILDAARDHFALVGLRRTSMEDVAKRAGISRITVYRRFPNKAELTQAVMLREARLAFAKIEDGLHEASLEDALVEGFVRTLQIGRAHPLVTGLLATEPEVILPYFTLDASPILATATAFLADRLRRKTRELDHATAVPLAEVLVRMTVSFLLTPKGAVDLSSEKQMRAFARRYIVKWVRAWVPVS